MRIGIKFCGGCNPRHDRGEMAGRLRRLLETIHRLEAARPGEDYDYLLLIGGCANCCADAAPYRVRIRILRIAGEQDFQAALRELHYDSLERK